MEDKSQELATADLAKKALHNGLNDSEWQKSEELPRTQV